MQLDAIASGSQVAGGAVRGSDFKGFPPAIASMQLDAIANRSQVSRWRRSRLGLQRILARNRIDAIGCNWDGLVGRRVPPRARSGHFGNPSPWERSRCEPSFGSGLPDGMLHPSKESRNAIELDRNRSARAKTVFGGNVASVGSGIVLYSAPRKIPAGPPGLRQVEHPRWAARSSNSENGAKPGEARRTRRLITRACVRRFRDRLPLLPELASSELRAGYVYNLCGGRRLFVSFGRVSGPDYGFNSHRHQRLSASSIQRLLWRFWPALSGSPLA